MWIHVHPEHGAYKIVVYHKFFMKQINLYVMDRL